MTLTEALRELHNEGYTHVTAGHVSLLLWPHTYRRTRAEEMQRLVRLAKTDPDEAHRQLRRLDRSPVVYDGAKLEPAVRHAYSRLAGTLPDAATRLEPIDYYRSRV